MQSVTFRILAAATYLFAAFYSSPATAKIYWLPDFLGSNTERSSAAGKDMDTSGGDDSSGCARWGMLSLAQISERGLRPAYCSTHSFPGVGNCYDNCRCPAAFHWTDGNCFGNLKPSGPTCDGRYAACLCDTSRFPYTSCPSGSIPGGTSCDDGTTHYSECIDPCESLTDHDCGDFDCKKTYDSCPAKCEVCYTDNCHIREDAGACSCKKYWNDCVSKCEIPNEEDNCCNREDNTTDYGCQKYWQDCPTKCEIGKTCIPTDCSGFTLSAAPANASYETCSPGCGDSTVKYKITQCNIGYWDLNNFLCNGNQLCTWKIK